MSAKSVVYKYLIPFQEGFELTLPKGSQIVRIDNDQGNPYLWALVPLDETDTVTFKFQSSKTGGIISHNKPLYFIGTISIFVQQELMLYVFIEDVIDSKNNSVLSEYISFVNDCWKGK